MKLGITGGLGFVGRHFVNYFAAEGWDVHIIDNMSSGIEVYNWPFPPNNVRNLYTVIDDVRNISRYYPAKFFDLIIHCAAVVGGRLKIEGDPLAVATDLAIDSDFFNWVVADKNNLPKKVIYFSSSAVYPIAMQTQDTHLALSETFVNLNGSRIGMPDFSYGWSKLTGEILAQYAAKKYGLDVVIYRPFSGYGEDQSLDYPFPSIVARALNKENPLFVWGSGEQKRDFIHIDDIVEGVVATYLKMQPGEVLNLCSGVGTSFNDLAKAAAQLTGYVPLVKNDLTKPEGVFYRVGDPYRMQRLYTPKISLGEGIKRSLVFLSGLDLHDKAV